MSFPFTKFDVERALDTEKDVAEYQTQLDNACNNIKRLKIISRKQAQKK